MAAVVKIIFQDEVRPISLSTETPYECLLLEINRIYPGRFPRGVQVQYVDDEDDVVIATTNYELQDAIQMFDSTLKLHISPLSSDIEEIGFVKISKNGQRTATVSEQQSPLRKDSAEIVRESQPYELKQTKTKKDSNLVEEENFRIIFEADESKKVEDQKLTHISTTENVKEGESDHITRRDISKGVSDEEKYKELNGQEEKNEKQDAQIEPSQISHAENVAKKATGTVDQEYDETISKRIYREGLSSLFVKDINFKDGVEVEASSIVNKVWLIKNNGKSPWNSAIYLAMDINGHMKPVPKCDCKVPKLLPGESGEVSAQLSLPPKIGKYKTPFFFLCYDGEKFGHRLWATILIVKPRSIDASVNEIVSEADVKRSNENAPKVDVKHVNGLGSHFIRDINFPDNTRVDPGQTIKKSWSLKNNGSLSWPSGTKLVSVSGSTFGHNASTVLTSEVDVGVECNVSVDIIAPLEAGKHTARFQLVTPQGKKFGHKVWVIINVSKM
eukprot:jgi/Bigna1/82731/fgenesh1_pg.96_\